MEPEHRLAVFRAVTRGKQLVCKVVHTRGSHNAEPRIGPFAREVASWLKDASPFAEVHLRGHPVVKMINVEKLSGNGNYEISLETHNPQRGERILVYHTRLAVALRRARFTPETNAAKGVLKILKHGKEVGRVEFDPEHQGRAFIDSHSRHAGTILRIALEYIEKFSAPEPPRAQGLGFRQVQIQRQDPNDPKK